MSVADPPARENYLADIGLVVPVRVFEEEHLARFRHNDAAVDEHQGGRKVQSVSKDGELVSPAVSIGVFANLDIRLARFAIDDQTVGIITRLDHPGASSLVPRHVDGLYDIGFGGKELQLEIRRHLRVLHAALRVE